MRRFLPIICLLILLQFTVDGKTRIPVTRYGAKGDGTTLCTEAINKAINKCSAKGGGVVSVPSGVYRTGTIVMRDNVTLKLAAGATLLASGNLEDFLPLDPSNDKSRYDSGKGTVNDNCADNPVWTKCMILANGVNNASIQGGIIDGANLRNPEGEEHMRGPHTLLLSDCSGFTVMGVSFVNASNYAVLGYDLTDCSFTADSFAGGWDGIHIRGGKNCTISHCTFATGDDAIAGGYWDNMHITNCDISSACNGIRMIMPCDGLTIEHTKFSGPCPYEHITSGRKNMLNAIILEPAGWGPAPGDVKNVTVRYCSMDNLFSPFCVTLGPENNGENLLIENVSATAIDGFALSVKTWTDSRFNNVTIRSSSFQYIGQDNPDLLGIEELPFDKWPSFPTWGAWFRNVDNLIIDKVDFSLVGKDPRKATQF